MHSNFHADRGGRTKKYRRKIHRVRPTKSRVKRASRCPTTFMRWVLFAFHYLLLTALSFLEYLVLLFKRDELAPEHEASSGADVLDEQDPVQVIGLMLADPGT